MYGLNNSSKRISIAPQVSRVEAYAEAARPSEISAILVNAWFQQLPDEALLAHYRSSVGWELLSMKGKVACMQALYDLAQQRSGSSLANRWKAGFRRCFAAELPHWAAALRLAEEGHRLRAEAHRTQDLRQKNQALKQENNALHLEVARLAQQVCAQQQAWARQEAGLKVCHRVLGRVPVPGAQANDHGLAAPPPTAGFLLRPRPEGRNLSAQSVQSVRSIASQSSADTLVEDLGALYDGFC